MDNASRFVFSGPSSWPLEQAIRWAVEHGFSRVDFNADNTANYPGTFTPERVALVRASRCRARRRASAFTRRRRSTWPRSRR